ncbi:hypothetical protein [Labedaea rhizosphaerae]|uniref:hypothetical protein n=1 Tax=Labedaea rhizosphaerae TaxID=598644 RepID=UPI00105CC12E|nr:hypothetical protein [Labedaea rhizosphaerae]
MPWAGNDVSATVPPGQVLPPPIPGGTRSYTYAVATGAWPWAYGSWAGGAPPLVGALFGGIIAVPNALAGTVALTAWWPDVTTVHIVRLHPDGSRTPVRGGYPLTVLGVTRRNLAPNPSAAAGLAGYVPGEGNPALSVLTDGPAPPGTAVRCTLAAAGTCGLTVPTQLVVASPGQIVTVGMDLRISARPSAVTITITWTDSTGTALASSTSALSSNAINRSVAQWARHVVTATAPMGQGPITASVKVAATSLPTGATLDATHQTHELGATDGSYVDGDSLGGSWTGVAGLSASVGAPLQTLIDGEAPLDVPVSYQVINPALGGGSATSEPTTLDGGDRSWLSHPSQPAQPVRARVTAAPDLTRTAVSATYTIIGRARPVVVSAARSAPTGALTLDAATFADRDALLELLADGAPLLLRAPADYGLGYGWWIALGDLTESAVGRPQWSQGRALAASFTVVDAPYAPSSFPAA